MDISEKFPIFVLTIKNNYMKLDKHIAYKILTEDDFGKRIIQSHLTEMNIEDDTDDATMIHKLISNINQKSFWITNTVLNKLSLMKLNDNLDWTYFKGLKDQKMTFVFPDNSLLRFRIENNVIQMIHLKMLNSKLMADLNQPNNVVWDVFCIDAESGDKSSNFDDSQAIREKFMYRILCFFFFSENTEVVVDAGKKYGTKKEGKIINKLPFPITVVNSNWNITSIRTDEFGVRGHFAMRWTGKGRLTPKMVFIEPFTKNGYVKKAKMLETL